MDMDRNFQSFKRLTEIINKYRQGRTILLLGESRSYRSFLREEYGIKNLLLVTTVKNKASGGVKYIEDIAGMNDRYYIVAPKVKKTIDLQMQLFSCGYNDFDDCFFINHGHITVDTYVEDYSDNYGNRIHAPSCKVLLDEFANGTEIYIGDSCEFGKDSKIEVKDMGGAKVTVGNKCKFEDEVVLTVMNDCAMSIGDNTTIVRSSQITAIGGMTVNIGKDCLISTEIKMYCGDGHAIFDLNNKKRLNPLTKGDPRNIISIGDHVWIGMRALILNRTVIGSNSIVGAGSLVKGEFPNNCIIAGTPASVIRRDITWCADPYKTMVDRLPPEYLTPTS